MIVGLGNPGLQYAVTRHNCGFLTVDKLAYELDTGKEKKERESLTMQAVYNGHKLLLVKPQSYMNLSGFPVAGLLHYYKIELADLLVIYDDMDLPPGAVRLRRHGSSGGHNGMASIIEQTGSQEIARLKIGIGHSLAGGKNHVIGRFAAEEMPLMATSFALAADAALCWVDYGIAEAMNRFNGKIPPGQEAAADND